MEDNKEQKLCGRCSKPKGEGEGFCKCGTPSKYTQEIIEQSKFYRDNLPEDEAMHSIEGLSDFIGIARSTIYEWISQEDKQEFADIIESILNKQGKSLINNGITGKFSAPITKVILTKHGYREGIEQTGKDGKDLIPETITPEEKTALLGLLK